MSRPLLLAQITDSHLLGQTDAQLRGCNPWQSFKSVLHQVAQCRPDGLLLTGDLAEQGEADAYKWLVGAIAPLQLPTYWLPGNHDCLETLQPILQTLPSSQGLTTVDLGNWQLVLLNSVLPQAKFGEGHLSADQLHRLQTTLKQQPSKPTLIALHHHPIAVGVDWIDQIQTQNGAEFLSVMRPFTQVKLVVFGHIHHNFQQVSHQGPDFYGCPSTCLQVTPPSTSNQPGFRLFWLYQNGTYRTEVRQTARDSHQNHDGQ